MDLRIALAGNPNSGKTTLFNALTGSNQFVGNWPGVTVEKKEGKLKKHDGVIIMDLPGIYSLSPYTLEEVVARNYLIGERPDAILNIVDGTNLERNLYLTTQLTELGIPVVVAVNMMDVVKKERRQNQHCGAFAVNWAVRLWRFPPCKGNGIMEAARSGYRRGKERQDRSDAHVFRRGGARHGPYRGSGRTSACLRNSSAGMRSRFLSGMTRFWNSCSWIRAVLDHIEAGYPRLRKMNWSDDAEAIITNERYIYIASDSQGLL